jgi:hypothetical protein
MAGTRTPPGKWLLAIWLVSRVPDGISARKLQALLGVTYKTAFLMLRKIRSIITQTDDRLPLTGRVQAIGIRFWRSPMRIKGIDDGMPAVAAWELSEEGKPLRVKMKAMGGCDLLEKGNYLRGLEEWRKRHAKTPDLELLHVLDRWKCAMLGNWFDEACRWINRVYCGVSKRYLHTYLDEYCFRLSGKLASNRESGNGEPGGLKPIEALLARWCMNMRAARTEGMILPPRTIPWLVRAAS